MTNKPRLMSVGDVKWHYYECQEADDWENASSYFETLWLHYQKRGRKIRKLLSELKEARGE